MDRKAFYAYLRQRSVSLFGTSLSQRQVEGIEALLDAGARLPLDHMAHVLAEVYHETGGKMTPVAENLYYTAARISQVFSASRRQGIPASQLARNPERLANAVYGGEWGLKNLGNTEPGDGWKFRGMGMIQSTGRANAKKASALTGKNLVDHPEMMLSVPVSAQIAVEGCASGMFTGKRLSHFDGASYDHYGARAIVNGDKSVNGARIAGYAAQFAAALKAGGWRAGVAATDMQIPISQPDPAETSGGFIAAIVAALLSIFKRNSA